MKSLSHKYGIDILLRAFAAARDNLSRIDPQFSRKLRLRIVGGGPEEKSLKNLADDLGVSSAAEFVGQIDYGEVPSQLRKLDIYVAVSRYDSESFGVAIIEASSCGVPVIVSKKGGLPEVVIDGKTGIIVPAEDVESTAAALTELVSDPSRRKEMGAAGRQFVQEMYDWNRSLDIMETVYRQFVEKHQ